VPWLASVTALTLLVSTAAPTVAQSVRVVRADGPPAWGEDVRLVEELRIGTLDGAPEYVFGAPGGVAVTTDGTIWVADGQWGAIRRYTSAGVYIDQIGREGEGPGEFKYPFGMRVLSDGSVVVWDDGQIRISRFGADGTFLESFSPPAHMIRGNMEELEVDAEDHLYVLGTNVASLSREEARDQSRIRIRWLEMTLTGDVVDTLWAAPTESEGSIDRLATTSALSPLGYLVTGRNDAYALDLHLSRDSVLRIERPRRPVQYERAERREKQRLEEVLVSRNGRPLRRIPAEKPIFSRFQVDAEGRIWVQVAAPGFREPESAGEEAARRRACDFFAATPAECDAGVGEWRDPLAFEVLEPDGRFLGRVVFPNRQTSVVLARGLLVWAVALGSFGEAYVVRYRIEPGR
jgi:hypothetical protein